MKVKKRILIITGRYLPGHRDGGPVRSIKNLTDYLGDEYEFCILTCDRDHGDLSPYPNIKINAWNRVEKAKVYYVPPKGFKMKLIARLASVSDLVYVCGCFNDYAINTLILKRFKKIEKPVVLAAMGLFSPMAFSLKYKKKKLFTVVFNALGMFKDIYWSATSETEVKDISRQIKVKPEQFYVAKDLPRKVDMIPIVKAKKTGKLSVVWISRIVPIKNLIETIEVLKSVSSKIDFTIYGPCEDAKYWDKCLKALKRLPANIKWQYRGKLDSEQVIAALRKQQVFLFMTLSENYGHVIFEALSAGCPCILSDTTPWQDLEQTKAGYVYSLRDLEKFAEALESYAKMNEIEFNQAVRAAQQYAIAKSNESVKNTGYRRIFDELGGEGLESSTYMS